MAASSSTNSTSNPQLYRLTLGDVIGTSSPGTLKLVQGRSKLMQDSDDKSEYFVTLHGIKINKKIYQPTEIEAELDFVYNTTNTGESGSKAPSFKTATSLFMRREVTLEVLEIVNSLSYDEETGEYTTDGKTYTVAKSCFVYEVNPKLKRDSNGKKMYVKLNIFSMDKLMTLNKYSKCYVARKLGSEILKPESLNFGYKSDGESPLIKTNRDNMRFLMYSKNGTSTDTNGNSTATKYDTEFIQPYLVQYNESFYDFMVRTANRCGEFLYFENGQLTLGLPETNEVLSIDEYDSVTERGISPDPLTITPYTFDSVKDDEGKMSDLNFQEISKNDDGFPKDAFPDNTASNSEVAQDDFIFPLYEDIFDTYERECNWEDMFTSTNWWLWRLLPLMKEVFKVDNGITGLVMWAISDEAFTFVKAIFKKDSNNEDGYDAWIKPYKNTDQYDSSDKKAVQFAPAKSEGWTTIDYYNDILKHEDEQQRKIVCIDMGTNFIDVQLGQKIQIDGLDGHYVIIQIEQTSEGSWENNYETYDSGSSASDSSDKNEDSRSLKIFAIPSYEDDNGDEQFIPPVQPVPIVRKAGPQTAFVTDNVDPKYQGRVRVAYPWQSLGSAVKNQLQEATQKLEECKATQEELTEKKKKLLKRLTELSSEIEEQKKYVEADDEMRLSILESKISDMSSLEADISELESKVTVLETQLSTVKSEISKLQGKEELTESEKQSLEEKKAYQAQLELEILLYEKWIESKKAKYDKIKSIKESAESAGEEDDEKENDDSYQDIEIDNSVIAGLMQAYQQTMDEYMAVCNELSEAEEETSKAEEEKETVQAYYDESLKAMSSPWIRIASPMATNGGGAYFKPNVGDEVLINYDNDNIERPYVVGSLYSKNVLSPLERLERKAMPLIQREDVSMSLTSRNGHHITFTDPDYGGSFITNFISPGLGLITSCLEWDQWGENLRDLAGGIHIGDRYNINEIELCTHYRQVNIRSSLGTITLNAFKGINIDAPNADINIKGMNINLEAGNKVNIISGNNIQPPKIDDPEGTGDKIGSVLVNTLIGAGVSAGVSMFGEDTLDFSTIRRILEVFVRPVDGTLLIKSKRYLMIEAGPGKAMVKADRYKKAKKQEGKLGTISRLLQGKSQGSDTKESVQQFVQTVVPCLKFISGRVDEFYQNYRKKYDLAYSCKESYDKIIEERTLPYMTTPDIDKLVKENLDSDKKVEDVVTMDLYMWAWKEREGTDLKQEYYWNINKGWAYSYYKALRNLYKHAKSSMNILDNYSGDETQEGYEWVSECLGKAATECVKDYYDNWEKFYQEGGAERLHGCPSSSDPFAYPDSRISFKRKLILTFLYYIGKDEHNKDNKYIKIGFDLDNIKSNKKLHQEHYWKRQILTMENFLQRSKLFRTTIEESLLKLKNKLRSNFQSLDQNVWDSSKDGQILFSDREDATLNFEGTTLREEKDANIGTIEHLKKVLMGIK